MPLYECRNCSVLLTERVQRCPACSKTNGLNNTSGSVVRRIDAEELLRALE